MKTRLSTKGQLVIPREVRERHGWLPGTELEISDEGTRLIIRAVEEVREATLDDLDGCIPYEGPARTVAEMDAAIAEGAKRNR